VLTAHLSNLSAQWESPPDGREGTPSEQDSKSIVTGKISDVETGNPLENVIVFLTQTPFGSSSDKDGKFRIANIPPGNYEMVISRTGYERQIISLQITATDSLYFEIKLQPFPVQIKGIEILADRPKVVQKKYQPLFFPRESHNTFCMYGVGSSIPIGICFTDSAFYMYSIEPAIIDSEKYIKLWQLYKNLSQTKYDFDPMKCLKLHVYGKNNSYKDILPVNQSKIMDKIENQNAKRKIYEIMGEPLQKITTQQIKILSHFIADWGVDVPLRGGVSPKVLNDIFQNSVNQGILKRNIIYPDNSVNGYVYFPFPGLNWKATETWIYEAAKYEYELEIITPNGSRKIAFIPN